MSDQFFEDEESLSTKAPASAPARGKAAKGGQASRGKASTASARTGAASAPAQTGTRRPPSFFMVVVIAIVAIVLGFALGYFTALNTWSSKLEADHAATSGATRTASDSSADGSSTVNEEAGLPEGHPDLASLMNADGSIDEEKLAAYKAQLEAAKAASNGGDASGSGASN